MTSGDAADHAAGMHERISSGENLLGFALMGAGTSVIFPLAISAAAKRRDRAAAINVAAISQLQIFGATADMVPLVVATVLTTVFTLTAVLALAAVVATVTTVVLLQVSRLSLRSRNVRSSLAFFH